MKVQIVATDKVVPYARNPRKNEGRPVEKVAASLKEFGWRQPIVVDDAMVVIVGHTRLLAAKSLGMDKVPVHVATGLTPAQVKAYRLADNRSGEEAEWDHALLKVELLDLKDGGTELELTGFDVAEIERALAAGTAPAAGEDEPTAVHAAEHRCPSCGYRWQTGSEE